MQAIPRSRLVRTVVVPTALAAWLSACSANTARRYSPPFDPSEVEDLADEDVIVWETDGRRTELRSAWVYADSIRGWKSQGPGSTNVGELRAIPLDGVHMIEVRDVNGAKAALTFLAVVGAVALQQSMSSLDDSFEADGFDTDDSFEALSEGLAEPVLEALATDFKTCQETGWNVDLRPIEQILPETDYAKGRIRVTRSDDTVIVLLQPFIRGKKLVGWDAADSRINRRPFTLIPVEDVRRVDAVFRRS